MRSDLHISLVLFAVCAVGGGCKKKEAPAEGTAATGTTGTTGTAGSGATAATTPTTPPPDAAAAAPVAAGSGCQPPDKIEGDFKIPEKCTVKLDGGLAVTETGTLTIGAGTKIQFGKDARFDIEGKVVAQGTADAPITLTSSDATPNPGDWGGIVFDDKTHTGNVLDHVVVSYAGASNGYGEAAIHLYGDVGPDRVAITNSEISHSNGAGVEVDKGKSKLKLENNTFKEDAKVCIAAPADVWSSIGPNTCGDQLAHVSDGDFTKTGTWPKLDTAYVLDRNLEISSDNAPILTLPEGATVKVAKDQAIRIGEGPGGGLVAKKVTFTSAEVTPDEGDWDGLVIFEKATGTNLDGCSIQYAGDNGSYGNGPVVFYNVPVAKVASRVAITNLSLSKDNKLGILAPDGDCGVYAQGSAGNKSDGAPLCQPK